MICPFCTLPPERIIDSNESGVVIRDGFPISPGHTLIIPNRHVGSFFELEGNERAQLLTLLDSAKAVLDAEFKPQGYNIGINDGPAAGQTVPHLHIHLIPRFTNDRPDPRGGVRWIIPEKADYWSHR
jgi:diadenosine tetraphosphate (Ap4A) HIT family hydrolase